METNNSTKVGDYVFLFFNKTGSIFSARVLEKTVKETISDGLKTEFILEAYKQESDQLVIQQLKYNESKCKMFSTLSELEVELQEHINKAMAVMLSECKQALDMARMTQGEKKIEEGTSFRRE